MQAEISGSSIDKEEGVIAKVKYPKLASEF